MKEWRVYAKPKPGQTPGIIITFYEWDEPGAREWFKEHQTTKPGHFYEGMTLELVEFETREERIEKERDLYRETISTFLSTVLTIKRENLPEWMEYLAERINEVCEVIGEEDRFAYRPSHEAILPIKK